MSWLLHLDVEPSELELVSSHLWSLGTSGIAELSDTHVVAGFETESLATRAQAVLGSGTISRYDPTAVPDPQPATVLFGSRTIQLPDTRVFGHGSHPSTQLALRAISSHCSPGMRVFDFGCGTGVLAIAAALMGGDVWAMDNDPAAITATRTNAAANNVGIAICDGVDDGFLSKPFNLVVANLLLTDLRTQALVLAKLTKGEGVLLITGFLESQEAEVTQLFAPMVSQASLTMNDWRLLIMSHGASR